MRLALIAAILLGSTAIPAAAQTTEQLSRKIERLEGQMRAVQRKVFPNGEQSLVAPEIVPQSTTEPSAGLPASTPVADLTARVDALEAQLARLTGQTEENAHRLRELQDAFTTYRKDIELRLGAVEKAATPPPAEESPAEAPASDAGEDSASSATPAIEAPDTGDPAEDAYLVGYRLWDAGKYAEAAKALEAMAKKYPKHRRASFARNLAGRAYLDEGKPATAAKTLLSNYQDDPKGERAADSLYFLGQALVKLKKPADACKVYDELQDVYGDTMRDFLKANLPKARADAKCD